MKKKSAAFALVLAGLMSFSVFGTACKKRSGDGGKHDWDTTKWVATADGTQHGNPCKNDSELGNLHDAVDADNNGVCDKCTITMAVVGGGGGGHVHDYDTTKWEKTSDDKHGNPCKSNDGSYDNKHDPVDANGDEVCDKCNIAMPAAGGPNGGGGGDDQPGGGDDTQTVLTSDTAISLVKGEKHTLTAAAGATFASSNVTVATVNDQGVVSAVTKGVTKVTATTDGEVITCTVIVLDASESSSSGTAKNPFTFNESVSIGSVTGSVGGPAVNNPDASEYTVNFSDGALDQRVAKGGLAVEPLVEKDGSYLMGWYKESNFVTEYDFSQPVIENLDLHAKWGDNKGLELVQGNFESIALEWSGTAGEVKYKLSSESTWTTIDSELVRADGGSVRADIVGLKAGTYDVQANGQTLEGIPVKKYDRSGYAHFNYNTGVGAYKDDGTLKDGALIIYVTEANKNNILDSVYRKNGQNIEKFDISEHLVATVDSLGVTKGQQTGIGEILNNRRYSGNDRLGVGIAKLCDEYGAVAIRFIGTVKNTTDYGTADQRKKGYANYGKTEINGLTWYAKSGDHTPYDLDNENSKYSKGMAVPNGGTVNDDGSMARITNAHDVTIEGIGDDAEIKGWGFHFVSSQQSGRSAKAGSSFEVRNLTFNEYPEDAIGFEGEAESKKITSPVQRCWVHNNTFLPGHCPVPAESDKAEGDGSCDFKRGYYFTCSYNYFEYCHKTNLVGSADDSLQFNMTYHHNIWYQCGSRIPLTRQANVHFYNNYVFADPSETSTPYSNSKPELSYVHSLRASCYLFSEYNYYDGCKNILRGSEGGSGKFYSNIYYSCLDTKVSVTEVGSRTQSISNSCNDPTPTTGHNYNTFDTDPNLFYYDATNQKTAPQGGILDDSLSARLRNIFYAGAQGHGNVTKKMQQMNKAAPVSDPTINSSTHSKGFKAKGQAIVFSVTARAVLTIAATGDYPPQVIRNDGKVYLDTFSGDASVALDPGIYIVGSGKKDKEIVITLLSVEENSAEAKAARIAKAERLINAIPETITRSSEAAIKQAEAAYKELISDEERNALAAGVAERLAKAQAAYDEILVKYAIARIDYIGTVTVDSKNDIQLAASALAAVPASAQSRVTNVAKLRAAQEAFAEFELDSVKFEIGRLPAASNLDVLLDSKVAIVLALELYNEVYLTYGELDPDVKGSVDITNITASLDKLNAALARIELAEQQAQNLADFNELLETMSTTDVDMTKAAQLKALYDELTEAQLATLTDAQKTKYEAIKEAYIEYTSQAVAITFIGGVPSNDMVKSTGSKQNAKNTKFTVNAYSTTEQLASGLKFESGTQITITLTTKMTLTFYMFNTNALLIDDKSEAVASANGDNVVTITLEAGAHTVARASSENSLYYLTLTPAK